MIKFHALMHSQTLNVVKLQGFKVKILDVYVHVSARSFTPLYTTLVILQNFLKSSHSNYVASNFIHKMLATGLVYFWCKSNVATKDCSVLNISNWCFLEIPTVQLGTVFINPVTFIIARKYLDTLTCIILLL